jgi:hypothetical protein
MNARSLIVISSSLMVTQVDPSPGGVRTPSDSALRALYHGPGALVRFSVKDVRVMLQQGILPEDSSTELLNGLIVTKDRGDRGGAAGMIGLKHRVCVEKLSNLRSVINSTARHVQSQQPVECGDESTPEPDFIVVRGTVGDYTEREVTAADVLCVIEVADTSYERDSGEKLIVYARAGVPVYVIIHLTPRTAEVHTDPDRTAGYYATRRVVNERETLAIPLGEGASHEVLLGDVLP